MVGGFFGEERRGGCVVFLYLQCLAEVTEVLRYLSNRGQAELDSIWICHKEVNS